MQEWSHFGKDRLNNMNLEERPRLLQTICDSLDKAQLNRLVRDSLHHTLEYYATMPDLPSTVDKLLEELERRGELVTFLLHVRDKSASTSALHSAISAYFGLVGTAAGTEKAIQLHSRRPETPLPDDYEPCLFNGPSQRDGEPLTMQAHVNLWDEANYPRCCFLLGAHGQDLQAALLDVEVALAGRGRGGEATIWIRDDRLFLDADSQRARSVEEQIALMFQQVWPEATEYSQRRLEKVLATNRYIFLVDLSSVKLNDLFPLPDNEPQSRLRAMASLLKTVVDFLAREDHLVIISVPRFVMMLEEWQRLVELAPTTLFTADLFIPFQAATNVPALGMIPDLISQALRPLMSSNSYTLRKLAIKLARQIENRNLVDADRHRQLAEILLIAGILAREGFIEAGYRLEMWYKTNSGRIESPSSAADLFRMGTSREAEVVGFLENIADLPRATDSALITGESGVGKTTALRRIEASWCLPRPSEPGRRFQSWLPLNVSSKFDSRDDAPLHVDDGDGRLSVHRRIYRLIGKRNWSWILSSPILYLADDLGVRRDDGEIPRWIDNTRTGGENPFGVIVCCQHRSEAPRWFRTTFPKSIEVRLRSLDLHSARAMCSTGAQVEFVGRLFSSPCEPLNEYAHNRFLLACMLESADNLEAGSGLLDLLDAYTRARLSDLEPALVSSLLVQHFPRVAAALARDEVPTLPPDVRNIGISQNLLADGESVRFQHPLLLQYFLAKYIARNWKDDLASLLGPLIGPERDLWPIRYLNLFRMLMKDLPSASRSTLAHFLGEFDPNLAHRCLLELSPSDYSAVRDSFAIRDSLVEIIQANISDNERGQDLDLEMKVAAADSLGWYDPRIPAPGTANGNFVELRVAGVRKSAAGRYPVTNLEYAEFIRDRGYSSEELWIPAAWTWRVRHKIAEPALWSIREFNRPNAPVVGVSFYEALAYAHWFGLKASISRTRAASTVFGLAANDEWSLAAGLTDGIDEESNLDATSILVVAPQTGPPRSKEHRRTTSQPRNVSSRTNLPVGLLPHEPSKVYDLVGNVWEWCDAWFGSSDSPSERPSFQADIRSPFPVLVRGGPATSRGAIVMALFGSGMDPFSRMFNVGFRLFEREAENSHE